MKREKEKKDSIRIIDLSIYDNDLAEENMLNDEDIDD